MDAVSGDQIELMGARLRLRAPTERDAGFARDMYSRAEVTRFLGTHDWTETTHEEALARIRRYREHFGPGTGAWLIETLETGSSAGFALMKPIPFSAHVKDESAEDIEIGWHLHPDAWGSGYATEAARLLIAHARRAGHRELAAVTNPENLASQRVAARIGMIHQGPSNRYYDTTCELFTLDLSAPPQPTHR